MSIIAIITSLLLLPILTVMVSVKHASMKRHFMHKVRTLGNVSNAKEFREWVDTLSIVQIKDELKKIREHRLSSTLRKFLLTQSCNV